MNLPSYTPIWNWRGRTNKLGRYPIHIRITLGRKSKYHNVKLPQTVRKEEWADSFEINQAIKESLDSGQGNCVPNFLSKSVEN